MNIYALIQNGIVVNTVNAQSTDTQDPTYIWVDITTISPQPGIGWNYNGTVFTAPTGSPPLTEQQIVEAEIAAASIFGENLITQFAAQNAIAGITTAGATLAVLSYTADLSQCLYTGSLTAAITIMQGMLTDTSSAKTACSPFITNDIIYSYLNQVQTYLGIPLTPNPGP
jgi:hypothetical protein